MTSRRPAHSLPGSFVKEKRSPFKPKLPSALDGLETISSGDDASFTKGHDDEPRRVAHSALAAIFSTLQQTSGCGSIGMPLFGELGTGSL